MSLQTPENGTIAEMWKNALAEFEQLVPDKGFKNLAVSTTPEDLRKKIEALNAEAEAKKSPNASRVKDIGLKVIEVIKTIGGVAAETAGLVFGPAQVCYGALSIFLSIPGKVREFHEFIESVFIELNPVLSQFDIYIKMEKDHSIHENLQTAIHTVMAGFVHLCGKVISLQQGGKWERFKRHTKQILADDKELQEELEKFKRVVSGLHGIQITATYEGVVETRAGVFEVQRSVDGVGGNVKKLVDEQNKRTRDDKRKTALNDIRTLLGLEGDDSTHPRARHDTIAAGHLKDTGKWLLEDERFQKWANRHHSEADSTLFLTGGPGFGKSFLLSTVIEYLKEQASAPGLGRRSLVSFYFSPAQREKNVDQTNLLAETALKWTAFQIVEQDDTICKTLSTMAKSPDRVAEVRRAGFSGLWDILKIGSPSPRTTNYLVFDDVDKFSDSARQQLGKILSGFSDREVEECTIKVLVCGDLDLESFGPLKANPGYVINVDVGSMKEDFTLYIRQKLRLPNMLPGPACADMRARVGEKLLATPGCNFRTIDIAMKGIERVIATSGDEGDMFRVVERSTQNEDDAMKELLAQLQAELGPLQIKQINEILIWVLYGNDDGDTDQFYVVALEAAFRVRNKRLPIEGLPNFIKRSAKGLMHMADDSETTIVLDEGVRKAIIKPRAVSRLAEPPRIKLEIKIVNADLPTARRFFWDLAKYATLEQFDFSPDSPNAQSSNSKGIIAVNTVDAHLAIVQATLDFFSKPPAPETESIGPCLLKNFARHLKVLYDATGLDAIDYELKAKIGKFVYTLFADPRVIKMHWNSTFDAYRYILSHEPMSELWRWLEDKTATGTLGTKDENWLNMCLASEDKTMALVEDIAHMIAQMWFQDKEFYGHAYLWIAQFVEKPWKAENAEPSPDERRRIAEAEAWCRSKLNVSEDSLPPLWYEKLGRTYATFGHYDEAIVNFQKSTDLSGPDSASWYTMVGLSEAMLNVSRKLEEQKKAIDIKEKALEIYLGPKGSDIPTAAKLEELESIARWCLIVFEQEDRALKHRRMALDLAPDDGDVQYALFNHLIGYGRGNEARDMLRSLVAENHKTEGDEGQKRFPFADLLSALVMDRWWESVHAKFWGFLSAARDVGVLDQVMVDFEEAISRVKNSPDESTLHLLLVLHKGMAHFYHEKGDPEEIKLALKIWQDAVDISHEYQNSGNMPEFEIYYKIAALLGRYFFDEAHKRLKALERNPDAGPEEVTNLRGAMLEYVQKLDQMVAEHDAALPSNEVSIAKFYKAAFLALRGNHGAARAMFKQDMVQVINLLSDDEQGNDEFALAKLLVILHFSGDIENAMAGSCLISPAYIGKKVPGRLRSALQRLFDATGELDEPLEGSPANQLLKIFDAEMEADRELHVIMNKLKTEAAKNLAGGRGTGSKGGKSSAVKDETGSDNVAASQEDPTLVEGDGNGGGDETAKTWGDLYKCLSIVQSRGLVSNDRGQRYCNKCPGKGNQWDFDHNFYTCKYCFDVDLCEQCCDELRAADPEIQHPVCSPSHDWFLLPKWTVDSWAESIRMVVRLPKRNDEGVLVPGDKTVELAEWLTKVTEPWGGLEVGKTWDHVKTPPPPPPPDSESGSDSASEAEEGEDGGDKAKDGEGKDDGENEKTNAEVDGVAEEKRGQGSKESEGGESSEHDGE